MKKSAGIVLYKTAGPQLEIFLVHPGGPFWKNKDLAAWSIPKGEFIKEDPLEAAIREFREETGYTLSGDFKPLTPVKQKSGKIVYAWALEQDINADNIASNLFEVEWPPKSGRLQAFPEVDKAAWFTPAIALQKIVPGQAGLVRELMDLLDHQ